MKNKTKKLKKLINCSIESSIDTIYKKSPSPRPDIFHSKLSDLEKKMIKNMVIGLSSKKDILSIQISDDSINISGEYSSKYLEINILKKSGISFNLQSSKSKRFSFSYESAYDDLLDEVKKSMQESDMINLVDVYQEVMSDFKLLRKSNLDNLLN